MTTPKYESETIHLNNFISMFWLCKYFDKKRNNLIASYHSKGIKYCSVRSRNSLGIFNQWKKIKLYSNKRYNNDAIESFIITGFFSDDHKKQYIDTRMKVSEKDLEDDYSY